MRKDLNMMEESRLSALVRAFANARILVLGDVMLDRFVYGRIERISPEAPVPVLLIERETAMLGGAANVARNIASLGGRVVLIGVMGTDADGQTLSQLLHETGGIENRIVPVCGRVTTVKRRYIAEAQQMIRVDHEVRTPIDALIETIAERFDRFVSEVDVVVLSDYAKGVLCDGVLHRVFASARKAGKPVIVDPKSPDPSRYDGAAVISPNLSEAAAMAKIFGHDNAAVAAMAKSIMAAAPNVGSLVITRSGDGMTLAERDKPLQHFGVVSREVVDVSGAGDTAVAALSLALASGASLPEAVELSNLAAGIAVGKIGTAEVSVEELTAALQSGQVGAIISKTIGTVQVEALAAEWKRQGLRVGFANGCFDLIHPGHISLLQQAKSQCDRLIVGLNTDSSVKRLKGPTRPVQGELARAVVLGALSAVDRVVLFSEDTPIELIRRIRPDVLVKGADYRVEQVVGADFVQSYGGRVYLADLTPNQSTTGIIARLD